jgi:sirohydrochlorin ferrochelatase
MGKRTRGILLVAHGSEVEGAVHELQQIAAVVRRETGVAIVEIGYLSGTSPSLSDGVTCCVEQGVTDLLAMPYFLSAGYLQRKALRQVEALVAAHLHVTLYQAAPLGQHPRLVDVVQDRIDEALKLANGEGHAGSSSAF